MELCDSESSAKKSHPQNAMGDLHPFEFEPLSLSLSAPLSLLWQKSHFFGLFGPWVGLREPKTNQGAMGHLNWYKTSKEPLLKVTRGATKNLDYIDIPWYEQFEVDCGLLCFLNHIPWFIRYLGEQHMQHYNQHKHKLCAQSGVSLTLHSWSSYKGKNFVSDRHFCK